MAMSGCFNICFDKRTKLITKSLCNQQFKSEKIGSAPGMHHVVSMEEVVFVSLE